jgi:Ni,Fe-hydrogenase maturation factor
MSKNPEIRSLRVLLFGVGNPSRGDDALGWDFLDHFFKVFSGEDSFEEKSVSVKSEDFSTLTFRKSLQLGLEDAEYCNQFDSVYFIDASVDEGFDNYRLREISDNFTSQVFSHSQNPDSIIHLSRKLFSSNVKANVLEIKGKQFELGESKSQFAEENLKKAISYFQEEILGNASCPS